MGRILRNFLNKLIDVVYSRRENSVTGDYWIILSYLEIIISNQRERMGDSERMRGDRTCGSWQ